MSDSVLLLLVEDDAILAAALQDALEAGGYSVVSASSGDKALSILDRQDERISGLITDVNLGPGPNGWEVARRGRELDPHLPIVYTSATEGDAWLVNGVPDSVLVQKPFASAQVLTAISALITNAEIDRGG